MQPWGRVVFWTAGTAPALPRACQGMLGPFSLVPRVMGNVKTTHHALPHASPTPSPSVIAKERIHPSGRRDWLQFGFYRRPTCSQRNSGLWREKAYFFTSHTHSPRSQVSLPMKLPHGRTGIGPATGRSLSCGPPCLGVGPSGHQMTGTEHKPEAAVIPRPSLPSPSFRVRSVTGRILVLLGLRAIEAVSSSGYPPSGLRRGPSGRMPGPSGLGPSARANHSSTRSRIISLASSEKRRSPPGGQRPEFTRSADKLENEVSYLFFSCPLQRPNG